MAAIRFSVLKRFSNSINISWRSPAFQGSSPRTDRVRAVNYYGHIRPLSSIANHAYHGDSRVNMWSPIAQPSLLKSNISGFSHGLLNSCIRSNYPLVSVALPFTYHSFSSVAGNKGENSKNLEVPEASGTSEGGVGNLDGVLGGDWDAKIKDAGRSMVDAVTVTGEKAKESWNELIPYVQQILDSNPYLRDVVWPIAGTLSAAGVAWLVMPRLFKRFHNYSQQGTGKLLSRSIFGGEVPYEKSFWGALEDPVRYLFTFMAFTQIGMMLAPDEIASQYVQQAWRGATVVSLIWFLYRWKTYVFTRALTAPSMHGLDRESLITLDKVSSVGLLFLGLMASAEACGVAFQSILTVGGIGGVATAFAAKDILGNVLSGLSMQFSRPFSLGDTIKAGPVEGQVVDMGLTTTSLLNSERFPVIVPNSLFSSQVIVNKSRAKWRSTFKKIPIQIEDVSKIPEISEDIKSMLRSNPKVFLGKEAPYCFLSRIESSFAELTLGCNLNRMSKDELYSMEQDILLQSVQIIKQHGATLGSTWQDSNDP
ncbi:hypothetical protein V2J09_004535 [Rumex salicifolius]